MTAQRLIIDNKVRDEPFGLASLDHFQYHDGEAVDPQIVLEPTLSLYCLDHPNQRAIFVATPAEVNLSAAPFYFQAQYDAALHLVAVSYDALHALARTVEIDHRRIIFVYSTGRCGSTLISHALNQGAGVYSFAEADALTQLVAIRAFDGSNDASVRQLIEDCTTVMCAATRGTGATTWAFKPRSYAVELSDLVYQSFPTARVVFLYRNAVGWVQSFVRAFSLTQDRAAWVQEFYRDLIPSVGAYTATHSDQMPLMALFACAWASTMQRCRDLQREDVALFCARYEDMKVAPRPVVAAMLRYCDVSVRHGGDLDDVLAQDSQAGTTASQAQAQQSGARLSEQDIADFTRYLHQVAPDLTPDMILPQTYHPA